MERSSIVKLFDTTIFIETLATFSSDRSDAYMDGSPARPMADRWMDGLLLVSAHAVLGLVSRPAAATPHTRIAVGPEIMSDRKENVGEQIKQLGGSREVRYAEFNVLRTYGRGVAVSDMSSMRRS
jgi:hypothetical protein